VAGRIRAFAQAQRAAINDITVPIPGGTAGHTVRDSRSRALRRATISNTAAARPVQVSPVVCAGCYAPGGRYPLPSSVLMTAITARVAGVASVWVASPRPAPITVAAAYVADADALLAVGGAQAIAALAYGES
jgi:phosphoribosyl-ATP pyrophosphohydrolase/phosphoribosyl-AMP cyclohydrolase/histidinol dehydrogenase